MCLIALGSFALVGIQITGPNMRKTSENYFEALNLADLSIIADYGLNADDQEVINQLSGVYKIEYGYLKDVVFEDTLESIRVFSSTEELSSYNVVEGRLPNNQNEIALANKYNDKYKLGEIVRLSEKEDATGELALQQHEFEIVGFVNSGELISEINMGQSTAGTGELQGYAVVDESAFDYDVYMIARISFMDTYGVDPYSLKYSNLLQEHKNDLEIILVNQPHLRLASIKEEAQTKINDAQTEINDAKQELQDAKDKIDDGTKELADAKTKYQDGFDEYTTQKADVEQQLRDAEDELSNAAKEIANGEREISDKEKEFIEVQNLLKQARIDLDNGWNQYNSATEILSSKILELENAKTQLDTKQGMLDTQVQTIESTMGLSIDEVEAMMPSIKVQLDESNSKYNSLTSLLQLKNMRDAASGTNSYDELDANYQAALAIANLTEDTANNLYSQLDAMKAEIDSKQAQYDQLSLLFESKALLEQSWTEYNTGVAQVTVAQEQLNSSKQILESKELEYSSKSKLLAEAEIQLSDANKKLNLGKTSYADGINEYNSKKEEADSKLSDARLELDDALIQIKDGENDLNDGILEYAEKEPEANQKIADAEVKVDDARDTLSHLKLPVYSLDSRRETPGAEGYKIYNSVSNIVDSLADIFPIFLYFVAALVTLTTMTRFVDEERINSGTLKALGYKNKDIIKKFTIYGFIASILGSTIGIIGGHTLLPLIVYNAYGKSFSVPSIELHFYPAITCIAVILGFVSAVLPVYFVATQELKEKPSTLLQPKAPKAGGKILLEYIKPLWSKLSFTHKVTARNIFRYKKRMLMTIFGVCGAVTLIFAGFSVQHSVSGVNDKQFGEIIQYDLIVAENDNIKDSQKDEISTLLNSSDVESHLPIFYDEITKVAGKNKDKQQIKLIVPNESTELSNYIILENRLTNNTIELDDQGAVISERLAKLLNAHPGDTITVTDSENFERTITISSITEMYTGHFIFMNSNYYESVFSNNYEVNANLVKLVDRSIQNANKQASAFVELAGVKGVVQNTTLINQIETIVNSLNKIMQILIIVAILLAAVILYNLTNINVSERIRELSTIKVLGFYNKEVTLYIYRETIVLTLMGILAGFGFGYALYLYIISIVPPDDVMFNPALGSKAFIVPILVICLITFFLGLMVNRRLKNVDMLEALKSVE